MENDMAGRQLSGCVISLIDKAKIRGKLSLIIEEIYQERDIAESQLAQRIGEARSR
jgi:hypothetical protein